MAITITPKKVTGITIKGSGPIQGSSVNPQQTAPSTALQKPVTVQQIQPAASGRVLQNASSVNAAQAARVAAAAAAQAAAVAAEVARQKEARRVEVQSAVDTKKQIATEQIIKPAVARANVVKILSSGKRNTARVITPKVTDEQKAKADAYWRAMAEYEKRTKTNKKGVLGFLDNNFISRNIRESNARKFAETELDKINKKGVSDFTSATTKFQSEQAKRKAAIESAKFGSKDEYTKAVADYDTWQTTELAKLKRRASSLEGSNEAYNTAAEKPLSGFAAKSFAKFSKFTQGGGPLGKVWQYTLGEGSKNLPSLVTAPSRAANFFANLNTQDRTIFKTGGGSTQRSGGVLDAWQATQGQRNLNLKPWQDIKPGKQADQILGAEVKSLIAARKRAGVTDPAKLDYGKVMADRLVSYNRSHKLQNSGLEIAGDPLNLLGGAGAAARGVGLSSKISEGLKATSVAKKVSAISEAVKSTKVFKLITAEAKTPSMVLSDAVDAAKKGTAATQSRIFTEVNEINKLLSSEGKKLDVSIFDDFASLDDYEAGVLQRMVGAKLTARDRIRLAGPGMKPIRERLESIASRWDDFTEQMRLVDDVAKTRFGKGKKFYSPRVDYTKEHTLENYNFRAKKRRLAPQSAADLRTHAIDRYFRSSIDDVHASAESSERAALVSRRKELLAQYDNEITPLLENVRKADKRATGVSKFVKNVRKGAKNSIPLRRAVLNSADNALHVPTKLWKASVLKYRPAWYVNNIGYNVPAAALAGGPGALLEQARLLSPRYFRKAMREVPDDVKTKLANETGRGRLSRFASRVENVSRVGAFRALKKKGASDDVALNRVNKYLFDYSTKNWERPLRAVMPFWSFQKNLTKAAVQMPFDRPAAAIGYNRLDQYQQKQYDDDFHKIVPKLRDAGYSPEEIEKIRTENFKFFRGRIKIGGRYWSTPFNAFSEKGLSNMGVNPFAAALGEVALSEDSFGRKIKGDDATFFSRFASKFPQAQLAREGKAKFDIATGRKKPSSVWIGAAGSEGYGQTKEAQGYDPSKPSYQKRLDKGSKFFEDLSAFGGVPRSSVFDTDQLAKRKVMQKLKEEYFATDWNALEFPEAEKKRNALFKKYGVSRTEFYDGELARYDDANTKRVKAQKEEAYAKTKKLFAEYASQPKGTRGVWATKKLKELTDSGYFDKNPFLKSFDWLTPDSINKAYKKMAYDNAIATGDWSDYNRRFGDNRKHSKFQYAGKYFKTAESMQKFKSGEFWRKYALSDASTRRQLLRDNPSYAKHDVKSEAAVAEAKFWAQYARASVEERRQLIADNPLYNRRKDWTKKQWDEWRVSNRNEFRTKVRGVIAISENERRNKIIAQAAAGIFANQPKRSKKIKFSLQ